MGTKNPVTVGVRLDQQFQGFAKFGDDTKAEGKYISIINIDKWFKQANLFDKQLTRTDTGLCYFKFKTSTLNYTNFLIFLEDVAERTGKDIEDMKTKLLECGLPGMEKKTEADKAKEVTKET